LMEKRTRTWITIVVSVLGVMLVLGAVAIGGTAYWVSRHIHTHTEAVETAGDAFTRVRQQFAGQQPLIEIRDHNEVLVHRSDGPAPVGARPQTLHAMMYDPREERHVDVSIPFWLLRLVPSGGRFSFLNDNGIDINAERVRLTIADLERHGPGLVVDHRDRRGSLFLVWIE
jgi:hypothetical protein